MRTQLINNCFQSIIIFIREEEEEDQAEGVVQGPINKEPWEKLHPEKSGIRKL